MPFSEVASSGPAGYRIFACGVVPSGGGTIGNPLNVNPVSGVQTNGACTITLSSAAPANSIVICRSLNINTLPAGAEVSGTTVRTKFFDVSASPWGGTNCAFSFEVWVP